MRVRLRRRPGCGAPSSPVQQPRPVDEHDGSGGDPHRVVEAVGEVDARVQDGHGARRSHGRSRGSDEREHGPELHDQGAECDQVGERGRSAMNSDTASVGACPLSRAAYITLRRLSLSTQAGPLDTTFWNPVRKYDADDHQRLVRTGQPQAADRRRSRRRRPDRCGGQHPRHQQQREVVVLHLAAAGPQRGQDQQARPRHEERPALPPRRAPPGRRPATPIELDGDEDAGGRACCPATARNHTGRNSAAGCSASRGAGTGGQADADQRRQQQRAWRAPGRPSPARTAIGRALRPRRRALTRRPPHS